MKFACRIVAALAVFLLAPGVAAAQGSSAVDSRNLELWGGATAVVTTPSASLVSSYSPPLLFDGEFSSHGEQTLAIEGSPTIGLTGGMNAFITRFLGIQVLADWASMNVAGENGPYEYSLLYTSRLPPNDVLVPVKIAQTIPWPETEGTFESVALAFNAVGRVRRQGRVSLTASGGPTYHRFSGTVRPVAYTQFQLGGHSVLFVNDYKVAMSLDAVTAWGWNAGGDVNVALGRHAALMIGYRWFQGGEVNASAVVTSGSNSSGEALPPATIAEIAAHLGVAPVHLEPGSSRIVVGFKWLR